MDQGNNLSNSGDSKGDKRVGKSENAKVEFDLISSEDLIAPPHVSLGGKVRKLFDNPSPAATAELSDILWSTDNTSLLSYLGYRLADALTPDLAPLACEVLRRKSLHCTEELLGHLAQREYRNFMLNEEPVVLAPAFAEFRRQLADLCVSPECHFTEADWERKSGDIIELTTYPITILRRAAGDEVDRVVIDAATRGGFDPLMNRRALDILLCRELSNQEARVLPGCAMVSVARATEDILRDPFNRLQLFDLLDVWVSKMGNLPTCDEVAIRERLLREWIDFIDVEEPIAPESCPQVLDVVRLLRHFHDPVCGLALKSAAEHDHAGVRILAKLSLYGPREEVLQDLRECLEDEAPLSVKLPALRVFGYAVSREADRALWSILNEHVNNSWTVTGVEQVRKGTIPMQRVVLLQALLRRFYGQSLNSPLLQPIFESVDTENKAMATVAVNTFIQASQVGHIPPAQFYDQPALLSSLQGTLRILRNVEDLSSAKIAHSLAEAIQELFVFRAPAAYGFEIGDDSGGVRRSGGAR